MAYCGVYSHDQFKLTDQGMIFEDFSDSSLAAGNFHHRAATAATTAATERERAAAAAARECMRHTRAIVAQHISGYFMAGGTSDGKKDG